MLVLVASCCLLQAALAHKWYNTAPVLPAVVAASEHIADPLCYNHSRMFLQGLDNYTLWAVQMLDASVKLPDGIVGGSVSHLGHFDECLAVSVDDLKGQYCLVEISFQPVSYTPTRTADPYTLQFDPRIHVWEKLKMVLIWSQKSKDITKVTRSTLRLGLCMPSSCTPQQLQATLAHELQLLGRREGLIFESQVSPQLCAARQEPTPWSTGEIVFSFSFILLILVAVSGSFIAHANQEVGKNAAVKQVLLCFSVQRSLKGLLKVYNQHPGLDCLEVYKLVFIVCVVFGHRMLLFTGAVPISDANQQEQLFRSLTKSLIINGALIVDFFFVSSGTLLAYNLLIHLKKHGSANLMVVIVIRFLRLMPAYMAVVFFQATLFYRLGSGPLWQAVVGQECARCQANWWTNLLYLNNYVNTDSICIVPSWYLAVDTQLFVVCLLVVYAIGRWPRWGYALLATLSPLSVLVPFFNTWWRGEEALLIPTADAMADVARFRNFNSVYVRTENRAAPYLIGVITGAILVRFRDSKFRMRLAPTFMCFAALKVVLIGSIMASYPFYRPGSSHTHVQAGLYASLSRVFFAVSTGGVILLATFGTPGFLMNIAQWKPFRVLGRLVYGVYLVHMLGQLYHVGSLRTPLQTGVFPCLWMLMGDVMFSFVLSFLLTVMLESPVRALEKLVFQRVSATYTNKQQKPPHSA